MEFFSCKRGGNWGSFRNFFEGLWEKKRRHRRKGKRKKGGNGNYGKFEGVLGVAGTGRNMLPFGLPSDGSSLLAFSDI